MGEKLRGLTPAAEQRAFGCTLRLQRRLPEMFAESEHGEAKSQEPAPHQPLSNKKNLPFGRVYYCSVVGIRTKP
jgi:hypothetical protein